MRRKYTVICKVKVSGNWTFLKFKNVGQRGLYRLWPYLDRTYEKAAYVNIYDKKTRSQVGTIIRGRVSFFS